MTLKTAGLKYLKKWKLQMLQLTVRIPFEFIRDTDGGALRLSKSYAVEMKSLLMT